MGKLKDKIAVITGGAQGIGRAGAELFAEEGAVVIVIDNNDKEGKKTAEMINQKKSGEAVFFHADVSLSSDVQAAVSKIRKRYGRLDILYNNASVYLPGKDGKITDVAEDVWERVIAVNLRSIYLFCKYCLPIIIENGGGSVINTASSAGVIGIPGCDAYTASKAPLSLLQGLLHRSMGDSMYE